MSKEGEKIVVIGGGVGPAAGALLHNYVIQNTLTDGTDQDHLEVHHYSRSSAIGDRTAYLSGDDVPSPPGGMAQTMKIASLAAKAARKDAVAGVPCNTFHAPVIWNEFMALLEAGYVDNIKMIHMLDETLRYIQAVAPGAKTLGLMSTTGTRSVGVYPQLLEPEGYTVLQVPDEVQAELHDSIYNKDYGIKAKSFPVTSRAQGNFERYAQILVNQGAEILLLGCTEIPLAIPGILFRGVPLIDPMQALARALVKGANPAKLKPL